MRRFWIHCGLHKTGTTALQQFLLSTQAALADTGVLYPKAGRLDGLGGGHHNIAWQLMRDRRFDSNGGDLATLVNEVAGSEADVVLSSEDFESLLHRPQAFAPLTQHPRLRDCSFHFVIYVQPQLRYLESIFIENLVQNIGDECIAVVERVKARRSLQLREWVFQFDYANVHRRLHHNKTYQVTFRNYGNLVGGSTIADFLTVIGRADLIALDTGHISHTRPELGAAVRMFYRNRVGRPPDQPEGAIIHRLCYAVGNTRAVLSTEYRQLITEVFEGSNRAFLQLTKDAGDEVGIDLSYDAPPVSVEHCRMERVFSFESQAAIRRLSCVLRDSGADGIRHGSPAMGLFERTVASWRF